MLNGSNRQAIEQPSQTNWTSKEKRKFDAKFPLHSAVVRLHIYTVSSSGPRSTRATGATGESPAKGHEDNENTGASLL